jgi:endonuclease III
LVQINKTDGNDARGIAQMMRVGLYRPVHVKTLRSQKLRMLLTHRKLLQSKAIVLADVHASLERAADVLSTVKGLRRSVSGIVASSMAVLPGRFLKNLHIAALFHSRPHCAGRRNESRRMNANATAAPISSPIPPPI